MLSVTLVIAFVFIDTPNLTEKYNPNTPESSFNREPTLEQINQPPALQSDANTINDIYKIMEAQNELLSSLEKINQKLNEFDARIERIEKANNDNNQLVMNTQNTNESETSLVEKNKTFSTAESEFYNQSYDPQWDSLMNESLNNVTSTLNSIFDDGIIINSQECRGDKCRVEFNIQDNEINVHPLMFAAEGSRKMYFDSEVINGIKKTTIIYQR